MNPPDYRHLDHRQELDLRQLVHRLSQLNSLSFLRPGYEVELPGDLKQTRVPGSITDQLNQDGGERN